MKITTYTHRPTITSLLNSWQGYKKTRERWGYYVDG